MGRRKLALFVLKELSPGPQPALGRPTVLIKIFLYFKDIKKPQFYGKISFFVTPRNHKNPLPRPF